MYYKMTSLSCNTICQEPSQWLQSKPNMVLLKTDIPFNLLRETRHRMREYAKGDYQVEKYWQDRDKIENRHFCKLPEDEPLVNPNFYKGYQTLGDPRKTFTELTTEGFHSSNIANYFENRSAPDVAQRLPRPRDNLYEVGNERRMGEVETFDRMEGYGLTIPQMAEKRTPEKVGFYNATNWFLQPQEIALNKYRFGQGSEPKSLFGTGWGNNLQTAGWEKNRKTEV